MTVIKILHQHTWIRGLTSASNSVKFWAKHHFFHWFVLLRDKENVEK